VRIAEGFAAFRIGSEADSSIIQPVFDDEHVSQDEVGVPRTNAHFLF